MGKREGTIYTSDVPDQGIVKIHDVDIFNKWRSFLKQKLQEPVACGIEINKVNVQQNINTQINNWGGLVPSSKLSPFSACWSLRRHSKGVMVNLKPQNDIVGPLVKRK